MKRRFVAFVSALFLAVSPGVIAQEAPASLSLTVDQAVEYALDKNKSVASAKYDLLASEKAKWEAIAAGLPTIDGSASISNNLAIMTRIIDFGGVPTPIKFGTQYDASYGASASALIFNAPWFVGIQSAKLASTLASQGLMLTKIETEESVINAYYLILTLQETIKVIGLTNTHDFVRVNSRYLIDDHRVAVILLLKRKGTEILDKVIVDAIAGWASFEQIMDVIYNIGVDCDYRVVLYDENRKDRSDLQSENWHGEDWRGDSVIGTMLTSLLDYLSGHVSLSVMGIDFEISESTALTFRCLNIESIIKDNRNSEMPDRQTLEEAEFWTNYFLPAHRAYGMDLHEYCFDTYGYKEDGSEYVSSDEPLMIHL